MPVARKENGDRTATPARPSSRRSSRPGGGGRRSVEESLPQPVVDELRARTLRADAVNPGFVEELDTHFGIETRYGVTRRRLGCYLRGLRNGKVSRPDQVSRSSPPVSRDTAASQLRAHRARQASVSSILDDTFGDLAQSNPDLWDRRAYLMLVGLVYERLATNESEIPTDELVALAKVLAEGRRADARTKESSRPPDCEKVAPASDTPLPGHFSRIIRQVYGANLQDPTGNSDDSET